MDTPLSMRAELGEWNSGKGIDLDAWIGCEGRFALAVGYLTILWPEFEVIEGFIVRKGSLAEAIREFMRQPGASRLSVEKTINHIHLVDLHHRGCADASPDKLIALGNALREIYEAKLKWQFPDRPCTVEFYVPADAAALDDYELTFWQTAHEKGCLTTRCSRRAASVAPLNANVRCDVLELPSDFELIGFFEAEPTLADPGVPWVYNSITFQSSRGDDLIRCHLEPDLGQLEFTWRNAGVLRLSLKLNKLEQLAVHLAPGDEHLIASATTGNPQQIVKIRLKPAIAVEWSSMHAFP